MKAGWFWRKGAIVLLFVLVAAIRLPYLNDSPYGFDSWRQSDTEAMARNFVEHRFHLLYPQLNYQGPMPNYAQLELQVTTGLIAILYSLFGYHYALARIVPILFFMGSAWFVYLIALRYFRSRLIAGLAVALYGLFPLNVFYSRAIMPESAALFFYTGAFYWFSEWINKRKRWLLLIAAIFTALAISVKVPTVFVGIPMLAMALVNFKSRIFVRWELWLFALLALLPPIAYYLWLGTIAESTFVSGIATKHIFPKIAQALFSTEAAAFFVREMPRSFTFIGITLFVIGLAVLDWRRNYAIGVWTVAMLAELATVVAVIKFGYYLIFIGPLMALFGANALGKFIAWTASKWRSKWFLGTGRAAAYCIIATVIGLTAFESWHAVKPVLGLQHESILRQASVVQRLTSPDDLIAVGMDDPSLLNASRRAGWRVTNSIPEDPIAELNYFVQEGATYFVPLKGYIDGDPEGKLRRYLDAHYPKLEADSDYYIYKLAK